LTKTKENCLQMNQYLVFVEIKNEKKLKKILELLRGGYIDADYDLIEQIIKTCENEKEN